MEHLIITKTQWLLHVHLESHLKNLHFVTHCICMFHVILTVNSNYFPKQVFN